MDMKKAFQSLLVGLCLATISAAVKAYIDVEKIKIEIIHSYNALTEIKSDIKEIKTFLFKKE